MPTTSSSEIELDDKTQDMSEPDVANVPSSCQAVVQHLIIHSSNGDVIREVQHTNSKSKKYKRSKSEVTNALLEKMVKLKENNDKMTFMLEEK